MIALVIALCAAFAILYFLTMRKIKETNRKIQNLNDELHSLEKKIEDA